MCDRILTKFKLIQALIIVLIVFKNKEDRFKIESTREGTTFLQLYIYGDFSKRSRAGNSLVPGRILLKFEPIRDIMVKLVACKNEEDPIIKCRSKSGHNIIHQFFWRSEAACTEVSNWILPKFKLIQALIVVLIVCKNEEDPFKIESTRGVTIFLPL